MTLSLTDIEKAAKKVSGEVYFFDDLVAYKDALDPPTALKLIAVARAADLYTKTLSGNDEYNRLVEALEGIEE